jgi:hypothetical protein
MIRFLDGETAPSVMVRNCAHFCLPPMTNLFR